MTETYFAVLAIGEDTPGIVAAISGALSDNYSCNVETSQMTIVGGHFAGTLIASSPTALDCRELERNLVKAGDEAGVRRVYVSELEAASVSLAHASAASHQITASAVDRSGVLHEIAKRLGDSRVNITNLYSGRSPEKNSLCVVVVDVSLPLGMSKEGLEEVFKDLPTDIETKIDEK